MESVGETTELPFLQRFPVGGVAKIKLLSGDADGAAKSLDEALALPEMEISHPISGFGLSHLVELDLLQDLDRTETVIETADRYLDGLDATGAIFRRYDVLRIKGTALEAQGKVSEARDCLQQAVDSASEAGSRRGQWQALAALTGFLSRNGESSDATANKTRDIVDSIAAEIGDEELREQFQQHAGKLLTLHE